MYIAVISDSHDNYENLERAVNIAKDKGCDLLLHAGDFVSPEGMVFFREFPGQVHMVFGDNDGNRVGMMLEAKKYGNVKFHNPFYAEALSGTTVFMAHDPRLAELAAKSRDYDIVIHGKTHRYRDEFYEGVLVVCPGTLQKNDIRRNPNYVAVIDTDTKRVKKFPL